MADPDIPTRSVVGSDALSKAVRPQLGHPGAGQIIVVVVIVVGVVAAFVVGGVVVGSMPIRCRFAFKHDTAFAVFVVHVLSCRKLRRVVFFYTHA